MDEIREKLLKNRGIETTKERWEFLEPTLPEKIKLITVGLSAVTLKKAQARIREAIKKEEPVVIYGDYDADGICATAIMWETLRDLGAKVRPFIPRREKEGYGLSKEGIDSILKDEKYGFGRKGSQGSWGLIITVDSGIVAHEAVEYARKNGLEVIIIDHHEKPKKLPRALIIHTNKLCAAGISYFVADYFSQIEQKRTDETDTDLTDRRLELAAIATVTDLMPLVGANRSIVKYGLEALNRTKRPGLRALFNMAGIEKVGTYEIGYMIGPRINASGRIESALTALRLLCTSDFSKAIEYARLLNETNRDRQTMTEEMTAHAVGMQNEKFTMQNNERIIVIEHESYHQGVIGLVAGRLVEKYYLPAIVISKGETVSKASARSIAGFNIIEAIRDCSRILVNAGGHPMAAGFTIETSKIEEFKLAIKKVAEKKIFPAMLTRPVRVDDRIELQLVGPELYQIVSEMAPFGLGNPEPVFQGVVRVLQFRTVGQEGKHLKLVVSSTLLTDRGSGVMFDAIGFGMGGLAGKIKVGETVKIAYAIALDTFNGNHKLQLKLKDLVSEV